MILNLKGKLFMNVCSLMTMNSALVILKSKFTQMTSNQHGIAPSLSCMQCNVPKDELKNSDAPVHFAIIVCTQSHVLGPFPLSLSVF